MRWIHMETFLSEMIKRLYGCWLLHTYFQIYQYCRNLCNFWVLITVLNFFHQLSNLCLIFLKYRVMTVVEISFLTLPCSCFSLFVMKMIFHIGKIFYSFYFIFLSEWSKSNKKVPPGVWHQRRHGGETDNSVHLRCQLWGWFKPTVIFTKLTR